MTGAFVSVASDQDLPAELPIPQPQPSQPAMPPPPQGTPVSLLFSAAQHDDGPPSITSPFPVPTSGHKQRSDEDEPFNLWVARVWKEDPTYRMEIERVSPPKVAVNGVPIPCAGHLATVYDSPSRELIEQRFGGGTFDVRIIGPNPSIAGEFRVMSTKELKLPGLPKPPEDMQGSGNGHGNGYGRQPVMENTGVVNTAFATVHKLASDQMHRGDAMADKVAAERDTAQKLIDNRTDRVIESVRELSDEKAARARAEQDNVHLASRLSSIESRLSQPVAPVGPTVNDQLLLVDRVAGLVRPPNQDGLSGGAAVVEELRRQLNDSRDQARKDADSLRSEHANQIRTLQDGHRDAMASLKDDHRNMMELLKSDYRDKIEAQRTSQREDIERAREHERNASRAEVTAKQVELTSVQNELARAREDLREVKNKLEKVEEAARDRQARQDEALTAVRAELAEKKAELLHRPKQEATDPLSQLAVVERYQNAFGGGKHDRDKDDEPAPDPWPVRMFQGFMDSPMGQQVAGMLVGGLTGENDKVRRAQIAQQQINAQVARAQMARDATVAQARAAVATGGRVPPPQAPGAAPNPAPQGAAQPVIQGMEQGDPPFPPPAPDGKVLAKDFVVYKPLLARAELCVRGNIGPAIFLDQVCQDFQTRGIQKPATMLRDEIVAKHKSHTLFWHALKGGGAAEAFTGLDHPAGQRWLRALWALVPERATIEGS